MDHALPLASQAVVLTENRLAAVIEVALETDGEQFQTTWSATRETTS